MSDAVDEDSLRERLTGEQMIHRLRDWSDGDTLYGVQSINPDTGAKMGKTFREGGRGPDAADAARERYETGLLGGGVMVLYRGTVRNPRTDPPGPDPGEPPLKFADVVDVEILEWKHTGEDDE